MDQSKETDPTEIEKVVIPEKPNGEQSSPPTPILPPALATIQAREEARVNRLRWEIENPQ